MSEEETINELVEKRAEAIICKHLCVSGNVGIGFNVPADLLNDLEAWCDECESLLIDEGKWTDRASEFAGFTGICVGCFISIRCRELSLMGLG